MNTKLDKQDIVVTLSLIMCFFLFLGLKLGHVIDWSYWWITLPLWICPAILAIVITVYFFWYIIYKIPDEKKRKKYGVAEPFWKEFKRNNNL